jgi:hypothetical protein
MRIENSVSGTNTVYHTYNPVFFFNQTIGVGLTIVAKITGLTPATTYSRRALTEADTTFSPYNTPFNITTLP